MNNREIIMAISMRRKQERAEKRQQQQPSKTAYLYSNRYTRKPGQQISYKPRMDNQHTWEVFSIHPYKNSVTGRRQTYNTCKKGKP